jgi:hypothetical protein
MVMSFHPFEPSRLKIWRASKHIEALDGEITAYMSRNPAYINIRPSTGGNWGGPALDYEIFITEALPLHLCAIVGDIFHNLRTSLDLLASDLVRLNGKKADDVYFPFAESASELEIMIKKRHIDRARADVVDLIRAFKPYKGGNLALRSVHDFDIMDKHQALVPVLGSGIVPIKHPEGGVSSVRFDRASREEQVLKVGWMFGGTQKGSGPIGDGLPFHFDLTLPLPHMAANEPLVKWCKSLVQEFTGVVDSCESLCFGTVTKVFPWS